METFRGKAHLPGADEEWNIELEIDWDVRSLTSLSSRVSKISSN